jgi:glycosyltransferase involved in cell wall biosynthesis
MKIVTVVIPTYNTSLDRLEKSVQSVLAQTHSDLEIIVVDDGSYRPFSGLNSELVDRRIRWRTLKKNYGVAAARNIGISMSIGEYLAFLDAGDWWENTKIEKQLKLFELNKELSFVYNDIVKVYPGGNRLIVKSVCRGWLYKELLVGQPIKGSCSSVLAKSSFVKQLGGFYDKEDLPEDRELWLRLSKLGEVDFVPEPLTYLETFNRFSRSSKADEKMITLKKIIYLYKDEIIKYGLWEKAWSNYYRSVSNKYFLQRKYFTGIKLLSKAFLKTPSTFILKEYFYGFLISYMPEVYLMLRQKINQQLYSDKKPDLEKI